MPPTTDEDAPQDRQRLSPWGLLRNWVAWGLDYAYVGYWMTRSFVGHADPQQYLAHPGPKAPVVILPGVYERWQFLRPLADHLEGNGHPVHMVPELRWNTASVSDSARIVNGMIEERDLHGVIIVAHSKGGLIGKAAMLQDPRGRIDRMIAISTPFSGSIYARFLVGATLRAFSPNNATLRSLGAQLDANSRITSIWGAFDPHIPGGSALSGATNIRLRSSGHFRPLGTQELRDAVDRALADLPG
ncbi:alpha/beta fold hydrolase [Naasia lichenicola]|uniref:Alpha/beta hydrolase n=1 Tax=Naasia lichenicola TaxID=2565933 RepID=A0A4S4FS75_9MICO|nr:alpha/beta hydrolase [Naasia lichenicola]THG32326.1 alpha/beta hydrolase [Naasia lichenicola]